MNKRISCRIPGQKTHRPVLKDISNTAPTKGQLLALEYNKNRLSHLKEQLSVESSKRVEADAKRVEADAKRVEAEEKLKAERVEAEEKLKKKDDELAQLRAMMAEMQGKK
jgi:hypothetical protein